MSNPQPTTHNPQETELDKLLNAVYFGRDEEHLSMAEAKAALMSWHTTYAKSYAATYAKAKVREALEGVLHDKDGNYYALDEVEERINATLTHKDEGEKEL